MKNIQSYSLVKEKTEIYSEKITSSALASDYARKFYGNDLEVYESFFALYLNQANKTIGFAKIGQGGISSTVADIRLICKYAIDSLSTSVILIHNHPSGNLIPSENDIKLTRQTNESLKNFNIKVLDHIILSDENYYSLADNGII